MDRIAFFCLPKAFVGHFGIIQKNALASWRASCPGAEILLLGQEEGCAEVAHELGLRHFPEIRRNEFGTPLLDDAFQQAAAAARADWLGYLNADIILTDDFPAALAQLQRRMEHALLIGRRWNIELTQPIAFDASPQWQRAFRERVRREGLLYNGWNIDYFIFRKGLIANIPPFAVGRPAWDNWMIFEARRRRIPVVDATKAIMAVHQNHDYSHSAEGRSGGKEAVWVGVEAERNRALAGERLFSIDDATHSMGSTGTLWPLLRPRLLMRQARVSSELYPEWGRRLLPFFQIEVLAKRFDRAVRLFLLRRGIDVFPNKEKRRVPLKSKNR